MGGCRSHIMSFISSADLRTVYMQQKPWTHANSIIHTYTQPLCKFKCINFKDFPSPGSDRLAELAACSLKDTYGNNISFSLSPSLSLSLPLSLSLSLSLYLCLFLIPSLSTLHLHGPVSKFVDIYIDIFIDTYTYTCI